MSNSKTNQEQDQLIEQTPMQINPGAAKPSDFAIEDRDGGQCGDSEREYTALLAEADGLGQPIPDRNEVPRR